MLTESVPTSAPADGPKRIQFHVRTVHECVKCPTCGVHTWNGVHVWSDDTSASDITLCGLCGRTFADTIKQLGYIVWQHLADDVKPVRL